MVTTLDGTTSAGPANVEHAFQWDVTLAAAPDNNGASSVTIQKTKSGTFAPPAAVEFDEFEQSTAMIGVQFPDNSVQNLSLSGPTEIRVNFEGDQEGDAKDDNGNGRDEVPTELVQMNLFGFMPGGGFAFLNLQFGVPSLGVMEEMTNSTPDVLDVPPFTPTGVADSFFDVFFDISVQADPQQQPLQLHNETPARMQGTITHKPPAIDEMFLLQNGPIELFARDEQGNPLQTGVFLISANHTPNPRVLDFGDAPESYGTLLSSGANPNPGPSHTLSDLFLGRLVDAEPDGQPSANADGDDLNMTPPTFADDEDGLTLGSFSVGLMGGLEVLASQAGFFSAWFDFGADGAFDPTDQIFNDEPVVAGFNLLSFAVPANAAASPDGVQTYFRGRLAAAPNVADTPYGFGRDGEVEDYAVTVFAPEFPDDVEDDGSLVFVVTSPSRRSYDPAIAIGYDYEVTGDTFDTFELPAFGDNNYTLHVDTGAGFPTTPDATVNGLVEYDLLDDFGFAGVTRFRILGIETSAAVDPADPLGFATILSFGVGGGTLTMTPIAETLYVDEPADYIITTDNGAAGLDAGDIVTWIGDGTAGNADDVTGLAFGSTAFDAIQDAVNAVAIPDQTVRIADGMFFENVVVSSSMTIVGDGAGATTTVNGGAAGAVFTIDAGATVSLSEMRITNGSGVNGGGILNGGTLTLTNSVITGNATSGNGAGISNAGGATATIIDSTIAGNTSTFGGGIFNSLGTLTLTNSTVSGNSTSSEGGGISNLGTLTITNSTISNNSSEFGGGLWNKGPITLTNSTITGNRADTNGDSTGAAGGIFTDSDAGAATTIKNTIVAGNLVGAPGADAPNDLAGKDVEAASINNLIGDPASAGGLMHGVNGNIVGDGLGGVLPIADVLDTTLADNGGPTLTHKLVIFSPAVDAGDDATATAAGLTTDQRGDGFDRFLDGDFDTVDTVDIGAVEFTAAELPTIPKRSAQRVADPLNPGMFVILCNGTDGNDRIYIRRVSNGAVSVKMQLNNTSISTLSLTDVSRIVVLGRAGNDIISVDRRITVDTRVDGGAGNDRITVSGSGKNILVGGDGNDQMRGGSGRDILIGGAGADRLAGDAGDDLLIGGSTIYDAVDAALDAIMDIWSDAALAFVDRVSTLSTSGAGHPVLDATTITGDSKRDSLASDAGMQWIISHPEDRISPSAAGSVLNTVLP
jgi:hypothetical protein